MNPRHAAALALLGWYLMVPPNQLDTSWILPWVCGDGLVARVAHRVGMGDPKVCENFSLLADLDAPLSEWHDMYSFETLKDCESEELTIFADPLRRGPVHFARCVATDDPRLKGN